MSDETGKMGEGQPLNHADYAHEELYCQVNRIVDFNHLLRDIDEPHCRALAQLYCK